MYSLKENRLRFASSRSLDKTARVWSIFENDGWYYGAIQSGLKQFSFFEKKLVDESIRILGIESGGMTINRLVGHKKMVVAYSREESLSGSWDKTVRIWDAVTSLLFFFKCYIKCINVLQLSNSSAQGTRSDWSDHVLYNHIVTT